MAYQQNALSFDHLMFIIRFIFTKHYSWAKTSYKFVNHDGYSKIIDN